MTDVTPIAEDCHGFISDSLTTSPVSQEKIDLSKLRIDVVTDVVCPWCFIGVVRLEQAIAAKGIEADIIHHPFFLDPDTPPEGIDVVAKLRDRYGANTATMFERVETEARASGIPLDLSNHPRQWPTAPAHTLIRHAAAKGTQDALANALFEAQFLTKENIADPAVLARIAAPFGFGAEEAEALATDPGELAYTREAASEAARSGIRGVPFFIFNQTQALSGCQPAEVFREVLSKLAAGSAPTD